MSDLPPSSNGAGQALLQISTCGGSASAPSLFLALQANLLSNRHGGWVHDDIIGFSQSVRDWDALCYGRTSQHQSLSDMSTLHQQYDRATSLTKDGSRRNDKAFRFLVRYQV